MEPYAPALRDLLPWALGLAALMVLLWATAWAWLHRPTSKRRPKVEDVMRQWPSKGDRRG